MPAKDAAARSAIIGFYALFVFEVLYMISPFALQYYSVYGPFLNFFHRFRPTAWLTGFFLPHVAETTAPVLEALHHLGEPLFIFGMLLFLIAFVQIYGAKLLRRGAVTGGLYRIVRHPQYVSLAIAGLGMTLRWPRFFIALTYAGMLAAYFILARHEERECVARYGVSYSTYLGRAPRAISWRRGAVIVAGVLLVAFAVAFGLREKTLASLHAVWRLDAAVISPAPLDQGSIERAYDLAIREIGARPRVIAYVVPEAWYLADLPVDALTSEQWKKLGGHRKPDDFDPGILKVLITTPRTWTPAASGKSIVRNAWGTTPIAVAHVNLRRNRVERVGPAPSHVLWGDIPTPLF